MSNHTYYFAKARCSVRTEPNTGNVWKGFERELPFDYEVEVTAGEGAIPPYGEPFYFNGNNGIAPCGDGFLFLLGSNGTEEPETALLANHDYTTCTSYQTDQAKDKRSILANMRTFFDGALPYHGGTIIHASCIQYEGKAVLFAAPSQTGKSTHAKLWEKRYGAPMLSSDAPAVFPEEGRAVVYGMPWDGSDQICVQDHAPVAAIVELRQAGCNTIRRLSEKQAFRLLMRQAHLPLWDSEAMCRELAVLKQLAGRIPFYRLNCLPDVSAAELVYKAVYGQDTELIIKEEHEMKIKEGFVLRDIMDEHIVLPKGSMMKSFEGAVILGGTATFVWEKLQDNISKEELLRMILDTFDVDEKKAGEELEALIEKLSAFGVLEEIPA